MPLSQLLSQFKQKLTEEKEFVSRVSYSCIGPYSLCITRVSIFGNSLFYTETPVSGRPVFSFSLLGSHKDLRIHGTLVVDL